MGKIKANPKAQIPTDLVYDVVADRGEESSQVSFRTPNSVVAIVDQIMKHPNVVSGRSAINRKAHKDGLVAMLETLQLRTSSERLRRISELSDEHVKNRQDFAFVEHLKNMGRDLRELMELGFETRAKAGASRLVRMVELMPEADSDWRELCLGLLRSDEFKGLVGEGVLERLSGPRLVKG